MRLAGICALTFLAICLRAQAESLTVVLDFQTSPSDQSIAGMKREFEEILKPAALKLDYKTRRQAEQIESENLVVVRFTGACVLKSASDPADPGTLGFSYTMDGSVQPFGEIDCDRVIRAVSSAMSAADYLRSDQLLGRALGRVMAHEVVHMLSRSTAHARDGLAYKELTGKQLVALELHLEPRDFARLRGAGW